MEILFFIVPKGAQLEGNAENRFILIEAEGRNYNRGHKKNVITAKPMFLMVAAGFMLGPATQGRGKCPFAAANEPQMRQLNWVQLEHKSVYL